MILKMTKRKFLKRTWNRYSKLGRGKKKKQVWRKPKGRDNKMREKRKGYPRVLDVGYKKSKKEIKKISVIRNIKDLEKIRKNEFIVLGKIGKRKKIEIVKKAKEIGVRIQNINIEKFLMEVDKSEKKKIKSKNES